ncbi:ricin B lectin domain-containing protein [Dichomitus squalens]|nr:ricin B lectin domain-containing protein [Dichomitus squalens]
MTTVKSGVYFIQNIGALSVLDLTGGSSSSGTVVQGYAKRDLTDPSAIAQLWVIAQIKGTTLYTIQNAQGGTFLDLKGGASANETPVVGNSQSGKSIQQWSITPNAANTAYMIVNSSTKTVVDLLNGGTANGTAVNGWGTDGPSTTNTHQLWVLVPA